MSLVSLIKKTFCVYKVKGRHVTWDSHIALWRDRTGLIMLFSLYAECWTNPIITKEVTL
jgi:hypothetical protein